MNALKVILPVYFVIFVLGGFRNIKMFLLLTGIVTMPFRTTYTVMDVGPYIGWTNGINVSLSDVSFICLYFYLLINRRPLAGYSRRLVIPMALVIVSIILSLANSTWRRMSLFEALMLVQVFFLYYLVLTSAIESKKELRAVIVGLMISLALQGGLGILQYVTGRDLDVFVTGTPITEMSEEGLVGRALGTIGKPNSLAMYIVPLMLLVTAMLMKTGEKLYGKLGVLSVSIGAAALLLTYSRGGWAAFALAFVVLAFMMAREGYTRFSRSFMAILLTVLVGLVFYPQIHGRLVSEEGAAAVVDRIYLIKIAWNMIKDSPFVGIGANTFMSVIGQYQRGPELQDIYLHMVHNQYLLVFAETGVVGMISFLWLLIAAFREAADCARYGTDELTRMIGLSVGAGFVAMATHMMVDMYSSPLCLSLLFFFCGLCSAAKRTQTEEAVTEVRHPVRLGSGLAQSPA